MSFKKILQFNLDHRWFVMAFFLLITILAAFQLPKLRFEFSPEAMLEFSDEEIAFQDAFDKKFSSNSDVFLVVMSSQNSLIDATALRDLRTITDIVGNVDGIASAYSLAYVPDSSQAGAGALFKGTLPDLIPKGELSPQHVETLKQRVDNSPLLSGNLISKDGKYALIMATLKDDVKTPDTFYPVYEETARRIDDWMARQQTQYTIEYGGLPYIRAVTVATMKHEQLLLWPIVGLLYILALCLIFRSFWQAILPLACIGCVCLWAIATMVVADMPVTMINNTLPLLILVIGVTNGIYILMRILDERRKGKDKNKAIVDGVYRVALASLLTTSTTSIGFGSLLVAKTQILTGFGGITALAVMLIYVAIIFFMPQAASLIRLDPRKHPDSPQDEHPDGESANPRDAQNKKPDPASPSTFVPQGRFEQCLDAMTRFVMQHRAIVIVTSVVLLALCLAMTSQIRFNSKVNDVFQDDHPITLTNKIIEENLGGVLPVELDIQSPDENAFKSIQNLTPICLMQEKLAQRPDILSAISLCDMLQEGGVDWHNPPNPVQLSTLLLGIKRLQPTQYFNFITEQGNNMRISLRIPDDGFEVSKKTIADLRDIADQTFQNTPVTYRLTGIGYNSTLGLDHFMTDLFSSLLTAFLIIFAILFVSFRSFWSGFVAILPNLLPLSMTLAFLPLYGYNLNTTSVLVFTISIGLSVDNSIHIIQRFRQEYRGERSVHDALRIAMSSSGRAILQSNLILCSGLAVLLLSDFDPISRVGVLTLTTIGAALVVSMLLIPAEIACIGHKMRLPHFQKSLPSATH